MIKDALEVTRNLHRLIITASLVTIVFSLSLRFPDDTRRHRETISRFLRADFAEYDKFIDSKAGDAAKRLLHPVAMRIQESLNATNHLVFGLGEISAIFEKPLLLGRFKVRETKLETPSDFTAKQLDALAGSYPLTGNVVIVVAETTDLLARLHEQLANRGKLGMRVQDVKLETSAFYPDNAPPSDGEQIKMLLWFELMPNGGPPSQIIEAVFDGKVHQIPESSFQHWLEQRSEFAGLVRFETNGVDWVPELSELPRELKERRLGDVLGVLNDDLNRGSPESKTVSLLGAEIPGILLVYAAPLTLVALSYYFLFHLTHLCRFASKHKEELTRFAWLPMSLEMNWGWEALFSLGFLPLASLLLLSGQLFRFRFLEWGPGLFIMVSLALIAWLGVQSIVQIGRVRGQIGKSKKFRLW